MIERDGIANIERVIDVYAKSSGAIKPHFILSGSTGSGKTMTIDFLASKYDIDVLNVTAATITKEGTSGNSLSKALAPLLDVDEDRLKIIFVDEFDKLFISGNQGEPAHDVTTGVQNEFLKVLENASATVFGDFGHYYDVDLNNALFVFAGAFNGRKMTNANDLLELGVKTEFVGRVPLCFYLEKLSLEELLDSLEESELFEAYLDQYPQEDPDTAFDAIAQCITDNYEKNMYGARIINTLIHTYFIDRDNLEAVFTTTKKASKREKLKGRKNE